MSMVETPNRIEQGEDVTTARLHHSNRNQVWYRKLCCRDDIPADDEHTVMLASPQRLQLQMHFQRQYRQRQELQKNCRQGWWQRHIGVASESQREPQTAASPAPDPCGGIPSGYSHPRTPHPAHWMRPPPYATDPVYGIPTEGSCRASSQNMLPREQDADPNHELVKMIETASMVKNYAEKRIKQAKREMANANKREVYQKIAKALIMLKKQGSTGQTMDRTPRPMAAPASNPQHRPTRSDLYQVCQQALAQHQTVAQEIKWKEQVATCKAMLEAYEQDNMQLSHQLALLLLHQQAQKEQNAKHVHHADISQTLAQNQGRFHQQRAPGGRAATQQSYKTPLPPHPFPPRRDPRLNRSSQQYQTPVHGITPRLNQSCQYLEQERDIAPEIVYQTDHSGRMKTDRRISTPRKQSEESCSEGKVATGKQNDLPRREVLPKYPTPEHDPQNMSRKMKQTTDQSTSSEKRNLIGTKCQHGTGKSALKGQVHDFDQIQLRSQQLYHNRKPEPEISGHGNVEGKQISQETSELSEKQTENLTCLHKEQEDIWESTNKDIWIDCQQPSSAADQKMAKGQDVLHKVNLSEQKRSSLPQIKHQDKECRPKNVVPDGKMETKAQILNCGPPKESVGFRQNSRVPPMTESCDKNLEETVGKSSANPQNGTTVINEEEIYSKDGQNDANVPPTSEKGIRAARKQPADDVKELQLRQAPKEQRPNGQRRLRCSLPQSRYRQPSQRTSTESTQKAQQSFVSPRQSNCETPSRSPPHTHGLPTQKSGSKNMDERSSQSSENGSKSGGSITPALDEMKLPGANASRMNSRSPGYSNTYTIRNSGHRPVSSRVNLDAQDDKSRSSTRAKNTSPKEAFSKSPPDRESKTEGVGAKSRRLRTWRRPSSRDEPELYKSAVGYSQPTHQRRPQNGNYDQHQNWNNNWFVGLPARRRPYQWEELKAGPAKKWRAGHLNGAITSKLVAGRDQDRSLSHKGKRGRSRSEPIEPFIDRNHCDPSKPVVQDRLQILGVASRVVESAQEDKSGSEKKLDNHLISKTVNRKEKQTLDCKDESAKGKETQTNIQKITFETEGKVSEDIGLIIKISRDENALKQTSENRTATNKSSSPKETTDSPKEQNIERNTVPVLDNKFRVQMATEEKQSKKRVRTDDKGDDLHDQKRQCSSIVQRKRIHRDSGDRADDNSEIQTPKNTTHKNGLKTGSEPDIYTGNELQACNDHTAQDEAQDKPDILNGSTTRPITDNKKTNGISDGDTLGNQKAGIIEDVEVDQRNDTVTSDNQHDTSIRYASKNGEGEPLADNYSIMPDYKIPQDISLMSAVHLVQLDKTGQTLDISESLGVGNSADPEETQQDNEQRTSVAKACGQEEARPETHLEHVLAVLACKKLNDEDEENDEASHGLDSVSDTLHCEEAKASQHVEHELSVNCHQLNSENCVLNSNGTHLDALAFIDQPTPEKILSAEQITKTAITFVHGKPHSDSSGAIGSDAFDKLPTQATTAGNTSTEAGITRRYESSEQTLQNGTCTKSSPGMKVVGNGVGCSHDMASVSSTKIVPLEDLEDWTLVEFQQQQDKSELSQSDTNYKNDVLYASDTVHRKTIGLFDEKGDAEPCVVDENMVMVDMSLTTTKNLQEKVACNLGQDSLLQGQTENLGDKCQVSSTSDQHTHSITHTSSENKLSPEGCSDQDTRSITDIHSENKLSPEGCSDQDTCSITDIHSENKLSPEGCPDQDTHSSTDIHHSENKPLEGCAHQDTHSVADMYSENKPSPEGCSNQDTHPITDIHSENKPSEGVADQDTHSVTDMYSENKPSEGVADQDTHSVTDMYSENKPSEGVADQDTHSVTDMYSENKPSPEGCSDQNIHPVTDMYSETKLSSEDCPYQDTCTITGIYSETKSSSEDCPHQNANSFTNYQSTYCMNTKKQKIEEEQGLLKGSKSQLLSLKTTNENENITVDTEHEKKSGPGKICSKEIMPMAKHLGMTLNKTDHHTTSSEPEQHNIIRQVVYTERNEQNTSPGHKGQPQLRMQNKQEFEDVSKHYDLSLQTSHESIDKDLLNLENGTCIMEYQVDVTVKSSDNGEDARDPAPATHDACPAEATIGQTETMEKNIFHDDEVKNMTENTGMKNGAEYEPIAMEKDSFEPCSSDTQTCKVLGNLSFETTLFHDSESTEIKKLETNIETSKGLENFQVSEAETAKSSTTTSRNLENDAIGTELTPGVKKSMDEDRREKDESSSETCKVSDNNKSEYMPMFSELKLPNSQENITFVKDESYTYDSVNTKLKCIGKIPMNSHQREASYKDGNMELGNLATRVIVSQQGFASSGWGNYRRQKRMEDVICQTCGRRRQTLDGHYANKDTCGFVLVDRMTANGML